MSQSIYDEIGVQPVINARGTITAMGGNTPSPVMEQAMKGVKESTEPGEADDTAGLAFGKE